MRSGRAVRVRRVGGWCGAVGLAVVVTVLGVWLFLPEPSLRRTVVLGALACGAVCLVVLARQRDAAEEARVAVGVPEDAAPSTRFSPVREIPEGTGAAEGTGSPRVPGLPHALPSRRSQQLRELTWGLGLTTGLLAIVALALGRPQPSDQVARLGAGGAVYAEARILEAGKAERHDPSRGSPYYTARVVVELRGANGARGTATVRARSAEPPRTGDRTVLYAPDDLGLGAVSGRASLRDELAGRTFSPFITWGSSGSGSSAPR
ncbi:hypothetical protein RCO28_31710 [Streptomyces sp. LHD-70]|uniref:hypothetical protein n=1 Tax=Streptomyces sp. LHD-70 TaxID=3072140 RepID=UPI00280CA04F|nr:hypothetical protein [Streptomyces sp. LHD-70]MDQ8707006.1 hypothetical protein [Streptomyces sp. LHD-70]